jgi:hypothetical protein
MRLKEALAQLSKIGIQQVGTWKLRDKSGITLGDPTKYFPYQTGPQYPVETSADANPDLDEEEIRGIERRFNCTLKR